MVYRTFSLLIQRKVIKFHLSPLPPLLPPSPPLTYPFSTCSPSPKLDTMIFTDYSKCYLLLKSVAYHHTNSAMPAQAQGYSCMFCPGSTERTHSNISSNFQGE